jgi:hypothetical protein
MQGHMTILVVDIYIYTHTHIQMCKISIVFFSTREASVFGMYMPS